MNFFFDSFSTLGGRKSFFSESFFGRRDSIEKETTNEQKASGIKAREELLVIQVAQLTEELARATKCSSFTGTGLLENEENTRPSYTGAVEEDTIPIEEGIQEIPEDCEESVFSSNIRAAEDWNYPFLATQNGKIEGSSSSPVEPQIQTNKGTVCKPLSIQETDDLLLHLSTCVRSMESRSENVPPLILQHIPILFKESLELSLGIQSLEMYFGDDLYQSNSKLLGAITFIKHSQIDLVSIHIEDDRISLLNKILFSFGGLDAEEYYAGKYRFKPPNNNLELTLAMMEELPFGNAHNFSKNSTTGTVTNTNSVVVDNFLNWRYPLVSTDPPRNPGVHLVDQNPGVPLPQSSDEVELEDIEFNEEGYIIYREGVKKMSGSEMRRRFKSAAAETVAAIETTMSPLQAIINASELYPVDASGLPPTSWLSPTVLLVDTTKQPSTALVDAAELLLVDIARSPSTALVDAAGLLLVDIARSPSTALVDIAGPPPTDLVHIASSPSTALVAEKPGVSSKASKNRPHYCRKSGRNREYRRYKEYLLFERLITPIVC